MDESTRHPAPSDENVSSPPLTPGPGRCFRVQQRRMRAPLGWDDI